MTPLTRRKVIDGDGDAICEVVVVLRGRVMNGNDIKEECEEETETERSLAAVVVVCEQEPQKSSNIVECVQSAKQAEQGRIWAATATTRT